MPDYTKSVIYRIVCKDTNITDCYVGSTTNFNNRKSQHKDNCNNPNRGGYNFKVYQFIRENGGWKNWDMIMVEKYPCNDKLELHKKEREVFETLKATLNSEIPSRTNKEYTEDNKEKIKQYQLDNKETIKEYGKQYRLDNKEKIKQYQVDNKEHIAEKTKQYYENNKERILEINKLYRETHKEQAKEYGKQYREVNKEKSKEFGKQYYQDNKEKIKEKEKEQIGCRICKCMVRKGNFKRHTKTPKHIKNLP